MHSATNDLKASCRIVGMHTRRSLVSDLQSSMLDCRSLRLLLLWPWHLGDVKSETNRTFVAVHVALVRGFVRLTTAGVWLLTIAHSPSLPSGQFLHNGLLSKIVLSHSRTPAAEPLQSHWVYPLHHRAVAQLLRRETLTALPWQRILGSDGEIRLKGEFADEQRMRLRMEGVKFEGHRLNMAVYEHIFFGWYF
jgi:6-O-methylguanine DNA methyltransferase, DNA binding domain